MPKFVINTSQTLPEDPSKEYLVNTQEGFRLLASLFLESAHWHSRMWQTFGGVPSVQFPMDYYTFRRVVEEAKPDVIIETGSAFGGTTLFLASLLHGLGKSGPVYSIGIDLTDNPDSRKSRDLAADIAKTRWGIPLEFITSSSTDSVTLLGLRRSIPKKARVLVILDSDHSKDHVLDELQVYSPFVAVGSYMVVCDTHCHLISDDFKKERFWDMAADPSSAIKEFLRNNTEFQNDTSIDCFPLSTTTGGILLKTQ